MAAQVEKLLFVINSGSGNKDCDYDTLIPEFFKDKPVTVKLLYLPKKIDVSRLKKDILAEEASRVVAIGGDGTIKLVTEAVMDKGIPVGIIQGGSANGMAKELGIPKDLEQALELAYTGKPHKIHLVSINGEICIHLADLGFNAYLVRKFDRLPHRGMWGYAKATWHALLNHKRMVVELDIKGEKTVSKAAMVAIANATEYGTGLKINPDGKLDDNLFEVILVKDYSYFEILKVWFTRLPFNPEKVEVFQTNKLTVSSRYKAHFQVDGEYLGEVNKVEATLLPAAVDIIYAPVSDGNGS